MAIDTPAKIAIIGAGPIGLEATLYARFLGYDVELLESAATPCANVLRWGGTNMFTPFSLNRSSLGLAALRAQDEHYTPPEDDALLTHAEWFAAYLQPLAQSDLILDSLQLGTEVLEVGKVELHKADRPRGEYDRGSWDFRLRIRTLGGDRFLTADILLDCSGVVPQAVGHGGLRAIGEDRLEERHLSHSFAQWRRKYSEVDANGSILVVGEHPLAADSISALIELKAQHSQPQISWVTRHAASDFPHGALETSEADPYPVRRSQLVAANRAANTEQVEWLPETWIESVEGVGPTIEVQFSGGCEERRRFDHIIAHSGFQPRHGHLTELAIDMCPYISAPRAFAEAVGQRGSRLESAYPANGAEILKTSEPNYYWLGSNSFGNQPGFLYAHGLRQIRDLFTIIGDRQALDLYQR